MHRFNLAESTIDEIKSMTPEFGYNGFGEFVFYRTYSRTKEDGSMETWHDVVIRVTEGTIGIRKDWYKRNGIPWDEDFWQTYALNFAISMFKMEWLPPGRGLWAMGTEYVYTRGSMSLNNCGLSEIRHIAKDSHWVMDALMNGVGVGFNPIRDDDIRLYQPEGTYDYVIGDDRESWCDSVRDLIDSYFIPGSLKPRFLYHEVRKAGLPIRGFGGVSSGPEPLKELHERIEGYLERFMDEDDYCSVRLKVDIVNAIGCCVVAGNVRRSAELCAAPIDDPIFMDLKNYDMYPERAAIGWMSNNSVLLEEDRDFERLGEIADRVIRNGEPGFINLRNLPKGRIGKNDVVKPDKAVGFNPCLTGESKVFVADGRGYVSIEELANDNVDVPVYCVNGEDQLTIRTMRNPRKTGVAVPIYRVIFDDGTHIRVTGNHRFMLRNRLFKQVTDLTEGDQLAVVNRYHIVPSNDSYWSHYIQLGYGGSTQMEHRLIALDRYGDIPSDHDVHHKDLNKRNNHPDNLELVFGSEHLSGHSSGEDNPNFSGYTNQDFIDLGVQLCKKLDRRFSKDDWLTNIGIQPDSRYRAKHLGSFREFSEMCADLAGVLNAPLDTRTLRLFTDMQRSGYQPIIEDGKVLVHKTCEHCKGTFKIESVRREQSYCSHSCHNRSRDYTKNLEGQRKAFAERREGIQEKQLDVFTKLKAELGREPKVLEWKDGCRELSISPEIGRVGSPFQSWYDLRVKAKEHNHRVVAVYRDGVEDVYNGTVDDFHNFIVGGWEEVLDSGTRVERGIVNPQCGEQPLEDKELCTLAETCPTRCKTFQDWLKACEYATMYASTVTLLPTHRPETNAVMLRNRRIGVSIVDVTGWLHEQGASKVINLMRQGYQTVRKVNQWLNSEAGIPEALRVSTIKPGGTTPKLAGKTSGLGFPTFHETLFRVRVAKNSPVAQILIDSGLPHEEDINDRKGTWVFEWPVMQGPAKPATKASLWEQAMNLVMLQREWSDNAVSNTLYFKPKWKLIMVGVIEDSKCWEDQKIETDQWGRCNLYQFDPNHEEDDVERVLSMIAPLTKSVSLLPHTEAGVYPQSPQSGLTKEEYEERIKNLKPIDWSQLTNNTPNIDDDKYCSGGACVIPQ